MEILSNHGYHLKFANLSDGQLRTEDGFSFPIHRFALVDKSNYFLALFCGMESDKKEALIPGIKGEVLSNILTYIYTGEIHVTTENICDLIIAADYLLLDDLLSQMKTPLAKIVSVANSLAIFTAVFKINSRDIFKEPLRFIETHFEDIMHSRNRDFYELPLAALKELLSDRNLRVKNENVVWLAVVEWVSVYFPYRLSCVPDLLLCLATAEINESLAKQILQHDFVASNTFCQGICGIKSSYPEFNNLQILQRYIQNSLNSNLSFYAYRSPSNLHFIAHYDRNNALRSSTQIYVTYDEKLDLWRKVLDCDGHPQLMAINDSIYIFEKILPGFRRFSITEKRFLEIRSYRDPRLFYTPVKLNGLIYALGGRSVEFVNVFGVDIYDPKNNIWYDTTPMPPVFNFKAVTLNESIYVVGSRNPVRSIGGIGELKAEVYNSHTQVWNELPGPAVNRTCFALAAYHEKLYVIGGSSMRDHPSSRIWKEVEVFDPAKNIWSRAANLPWGYVFTEVVVINDLMIVFDNPRVKDCDSSSPAVVWNVKDECWDTVEGFFSHINLHQYFFCLLEEFEYVNVIAKENKHPETVFVKSPFS